MQLNLRIAFSFCIFILLCGCASSKFDYVTDANFPNELSSIEKATLDEPKWGIALSGGGIRSAAFQIGVLKYLYDQNGIKNAAFPSLNDIDLISSVSGGGYASHLLYTSYDHKNRGKREFGYSVLHNDNFAETVCNIYTRGNFVIYLKLLWALMPPDTQSPKEYYEQQIRRTFGFVDMPKEYKLYLEELLPYINQKQNNIPYPIINYTVDGTNMWKSNLYEVTPLQEGNEIVGYHKIKNNSVSFSRAVTISAAATKFLLKQEIDNPNTVNNLYGEKLTVHDGGKSENMGAIALIRRGIPSIIVSDAEHDPSLNYGGQAILIDGLRGAGYKVVEKQRSYLDKGFSHFEVNKGKEKISDVYYIKMQLPTDIFKDAIGNNLGFTATEKMLSTMRDDNNNIDCTQAKYAFETVFKDMSVEVKYADWLKSATYDYEEFLNRSNSLYPLWVQSKIRFMNLLTLNSSFFKYSFPHISTADQGLYIDQTLSLMGLGYQQAELIAPYINRLQN